MNCRCHFHQVSSRGGSGINNSLVNHYAEFVNVCDYIEINKSKYNGHFKLDLSHDQYLSDISIDIDYYLKYASVRDAYILDSMHACLL